MSVFNTEESLQKVSSLWQSSLEKALFQAWEVGHSDFVDDYDLIFAATISRYFQCCI